MSWCRRHTPTSRTGSRLQSPGRSGRWRFTKGFCGLAHNGLSVGPALITEASYTGRALLQRLLGELFNAGLISDNRIRPIMDWEGTRSRGGEGPRVRAGSELIIEMAPVCALRSVPPHSNVPIWVTAPVARLTLVPSADAPPFPPISRMITKRIVSEVLKAGRSVAGREPREHFGYNSLN